MSYGHMLQQKPTPLCLFLQFAVSTFNWIPKAKVETANSEFDFQLNPIFFSQNRKAETKNEVEASNFRNCGAQFRKLEASIASFQSQFCLRLTFGGHKRITVLGKKKWIQLKVKFGICSFDFRFWNERSFWLVQLANFGFFFLFRICKFGICKFGICKTRICKNPN